MSPSPTVANLLGPISIGTVLSGAVYGVNCLQLYLYYTRYSDYDSAALKTYVAILMVVDTLHITLLLVAFYHYTVECFGDVLGLTNVYWPMQVEVVVGSLLGTLVQLYFIFRVYHFCEKRALPITMCILSITKLALSTAFTVIGFQVKQFTTVDSLMPYTASGFSCGIACDSLIAVSLIYYLRVTPSVFPRTNRAVNLLILYALNTCVLNVVLSIADLVAFLTLSETTIYTVIWFVLVRVYTCSMLSTLNSRENVRRALDSSDKLSFPSIEFRHPITSISFHATTPTHSSRVPCANGGPEVKLEPNSGMHCA